MKLPSHTYLDEHGIHYEARSFPPETEKGAANVAGVWSEEIMITLENLVRASNAIVVNLTDREKPLIGE